MTWLIGLGGFAEAGKDAFADFLAELPTWRKRRMSEPFEVGLLACDPWIDVREPVPGMDLGTTFPRFVRYTEIHKAIGYEKSKKIPEVRRFTQHFATEAGRDIHGQDCWTEIARRSCQKDRGEGFNVVLTGTRFFEEVDMVAEEGGFTIWVDRPGYGPVNSHASDNTLGPDDFDYVLENKGMLQDLADHATALDTILSNFTFDGEPPQEWPQLVGSLPLFRFSTKFLDGLQLADTE